MTTRIRPEKLLEYLYSGMPFVPGTVLEEQLLLTSRQLRVANRRGIIDSVKVGSLLFYNADLAAEKAEEIKAAGCAPDDAE